MPHARVISNNITYPYEQDNYTFIDEYVNTINSNYSLILIKDKQYQRYLFLRLKKEGEDKFLIKFAGDMSHDFIDTLTIKNVISSFIVNNIIKVIDANFNVIIKDHIIPPCIILQPKEFLKNINTNNKIIIEIGFGNGDILISRALKEPNHMFIGMELYKPSFNSMIKKINQHNINNIFLMNIDSRMAMHYLPNNIVDEIYMYFPMPWDKSTSRRVINESFIDSMTNALKKHGFFHLKTDSRSYINDFMQLLLNKPTALFYTSKNLETGIKSKYHKKWLEQDKDIYSCYCYFSHTQKNSEENIEEKEAIKETNNTDNFITQIQSILNKNIDLHPMKIINKDGFLYIKNIYQSNSNYLLSLCYGTSKYMTKLTLFITKTNNKFTITEILGDPNINIIPSSIMEQI